jgi:hypothetical protein
MQSITPTQLVLQSRATIGHRSQRVGLLFMGAAVLLLFGIAVMLLYLTAAKSGKPVDWHALLTKSLKKLQEDYAQVFFFALAILGSVVQIFYIVLARRWERLKLDELGISYVSPLPKALQLLNSSWSLQWSQIQRVEFKKKTYMGRPELVTLVLCTGRQERSLRPYMWVDAATYPPPPLKKEFQLGRPKPEEVIARVNDSAVIRFIQTRTHLKIESPDLSKTKPYALESNPVALAFVALFFVSLGYAFIDTLILNPESYVAQPPYGVYGLGGLTVSVIAAWLMRRARVPIAESIVVAVLTGAAFGALLYPALLRINQLTDSEGLYSYQYKMIRPCYFVPEREGLPELQFPERHREFWSQYDSGTIEEFELRKGGLDFYQINMKPIYERIENYYKHKGR